MKVALQYITSGRLGNWDDAPEIERVTVEAVSPFVLAMQFRDVLRVRDIAHDRQRAMVMEAVTGAPHAELVAFEDAFLTNFWVGGYRARWRGETAVTRRGRGLTATP